MGRSAGARILVLPVSAFLGIINTHLIITHFGEAAFAQYGLLVGIGSLLPFADLGMTAALMNVIAQSNQPAADPAVRRILTTALRVLACSCGVLILIAIIVTWTGSWRGLLGDALVPHSGPIAAGLCLGLIALTLLFGFGQRILNGLGKNHVAVALLGLQTPIVLLAVWVIIELHAPLGAYVAVIAYAATFVISIAAAYIASRMIRPAVGLALRDAPRIRTVKGGRVFGVAWPMFVQMVALPIAMQTDRLVLSHVSDLKNLAEYNLASQIFTPVWAVISSAGVALWPIFARARANGDASGPSPKSLSIGFGAAAALICLILGLASPWLAAKTSDNEIHLSLALILAFAIFMVLQALKYPLGMYMTDARGLRYQALMIALLLPVNLGLSWYLAIQWGAVGPVIGSAIGVFGCQVLANWLYVRRELNHLRDGTPRRSGDDEAGVPAVSGGPIEQSTDG